MRMVVVERVRNGPRCVLTTGSDLKEHKIKSNINDSTDFVFKNPKLWY